MDEMGGEEEYDRKIRETYRAKLPEVSKKLFKLLNEEEGSENVTAEYSPAEEKTATFGCRT